MHPKNLEVSRDKLHGEFGVERLVPVSCLRNLLIPEIPRFEDAASNQPDARESHAPPGESLELAA